MYRTGTIVIAWTSPASDAHLTLTAPDESSFSPEVTGGLGQWTAAVSLDQAGTWSAEWSGTGVTELTTFDVAAGSAELITVEDLATWTNQTITGVGEMAAAERLVRFAESIVRGWTRRPTLAAGTDDGFVAGDYRLTAAQDVALRIAARLWANPLDRVTYSAPGASYAGAPDMAGRLLTPDEKIVLAPVVDAANGAFA